MASRARRPQFLLPWIALCTLVLGVVIRLAVAAPEPADRPSADAPTGQPAERAPGERNSGGVGPEPAVFQPGTPGVLAEDPTRPGAGSGDVGLDEGRTGDGLAEGVYAGRSSKPKRAPAAPRVDDSADRRGGGVIERHSRSAPRETEEFAASPAGFEAASVRLRGGWSLDEARPAVEPDEAQAEGGAEVLVVRADDRSYYAILLLDPRDEDDVEAEDPGGSGSGVGSGSQGDAGQGGQGGGDPAADPGGNGGSGARHWVRWFAAQIPPGAAARPGSKGDLHNALLRTLGERKLRSVAAVSRSLEPGEAVVLLNQLRRWVGSNGGA